MIESGFTIILLYSFIVLHHIENSSCPWAYILSIEKQPPEVFCKKCVLRNFAKITKKMSLAQVFSCEFCDISKNTFFTEHLRTTSSFYVFILKIRR